MNKFYKIFPKLKNKFYHPITHNRQLITKFQQPITHNQQPNIGFTLMEILIVISIIAILITVGMSSFSTAQKKGRDSKRKSDLKDIQTAQEQYYSVCGNVYVTAVPTGIFTSVNCASANVSIMPVLPEDPRGTTPYYCDNTDGCSSTQFKICAYLETEQVGTPYCVTNQQ